MVRKLRHDTAQSKKESAKKNTTSMTFREKKIVSPVQRLEMVLIMYTSFMAAEPLHNQEGYCFPYKAPVDDKERL
jgi:uncharacterized protein (UPF0305 family)